MRYRIPGVLPPLAVMAARPAVEMAALQEMLSLRADVNAGSYAPFISLAAHYNGHANGPKVAQPFARCQGRRE